MFIAVESRCTLFCLPTHHRLRQDRVTRDSYSLGDTQSWCRSHLGSAAREWLPGVAATVTGMFCVTQTKLLGIAHHLVKLLVHFEQLHDVKGSQLASEVLQLLVVVAGHMAHLLHHLHAAG